VIALVIEFEGDRPVRKEQEEPEVPETQEIVLPETVEIDLQSRIEPGEEGLGRAVIGEKLAGGGRGGCGGR